MSWIYIYLLLHPIVNTTPTNWPEFTPKNIHYSGRFSALCLANSQEDAKISIEWNRKAMLEIHYSLAEGQTTGNVKRHTLPLERSIWNKNILWWHTKGELDQTWPIWYCCSEKILLILSKNQIFFMKLYLELLKREMDADKYVINR